MTEPAAGAAATAVEPLSGAGAIRDQGDGVFETDISESWTIGSRPNGGYLLTPLARVASMLTDSAQVVAASAWYLRPPDCGPARIEGEVVRRGRSISRVRTRLSQDGRACVEAMISTGELTTAAPRWSDGAPEFRPAPFDDCRRLPSRTPDGVRVPMVEQVDLRLDPATSGVIEGRASGRGELRGWLGLLGEEGFDPVSLLFAIDALPPITFDIGFGWAATAELTAYVRATPAPGPVWVSSRARVLDTQWVDQTCDVWDGTGRLVAQATQLAKVLD